MAASGFGLPASRLQGVEPSCQTVGLCNILVVSYPALERLGFPVLHGKRPWTIKDYFADLAGQVASAYQKKQQRR